MPYRPGVRGLVAFSGSPLRSPARQLLRRRRDGRRLLGFGGLGTWMDIYDCWVYRAPEATAARIAARRRHDGLDRDGERPRVRDVVKAPQLGRCRRGVALVRRQRRRVVPPGVTPIPRATRGAPWQCSAPHSERAGVRRDQPEHRGTRSRNAALRSRRAVSLARRVRQEAGETPSRSSRSTRVGSNVVRARGRASRGPSSPSSRRLRADGVYGRRVHGVRCDVRVRHSCDPSAALSDGELRCPDPRRRRSR